MEYLSYPIGFDANLKEKFENKLAVINDDYKQKFKKLEDELKEEREKFNAMAEDFKKSALFNFSVVYEDLDKDDSWSMAKKGDRRYKISRKFVGEKPNFDEKFFADKTYGGFILVNNVVINIGSGYVVRSGILLDDEDIMDLNDNVVPEKIWKTLNW